MSAFFTDLTRYPFLQFALLAAALASVACGIVGSYIVVRRSSYIAGAIAHCVLGGMGAARYLQVVHGVSWLTPLIGATVAALLAALLIGFLTARGNQRLDAVLSAVWALGMAIGVSFISITPGYAVDLSGYLFGNILMVNRQDLLLMGLLNIIVILLTLLFHTRFVAILFNEELAGLRGINTTLHSMVLLVLTALTVVLLTQIVGNLLVIALLTLPAMSAGQLCRRMGSMMLVSIGLCCLYTIGGIVVSYAPQLPAGATIIECAAAGYALVLGGKALHRRMRRNAHR